MIDDMDLLAFGPSPWGERQLARLIDRECARDRSGSPKSETCGVDTEVRPTYLSVATHRGSMSRSTTFARETFTPAEAGVVTGVSPTLQRDWRRRGLIAQSEGSHARYTALGLAELALMKDFSEEGLGPKLLRDIMAMSALPLSDWVDAVAAESEPRDRDSPDYVFPPRYVIYSGEHVIRATDLNYAFDGLADHHDRRFAFVCDLRKVAEQVIARLPRPVWRSTISEEGSHG